METKDIRQQLERLVAGEASVEDTLAHLAGLSVESLGDNVRLDHHRALRTGFPEVVLCEGKTPADVGEIVAAQDQRGSRILGTRCSREHFDAAAARVAGLEYKSTPRLFFKGMPTRDEGSGRVLVVSAGTSDVPVAEEAVWTARMVGCHVEILYDVGVAGIHRLSEHAQLLTWPDAIVVVAGMEGALTSVVAGLVRCPVIGVPTSIGYGTSFRGLTALLGMLNSCAVGVSVMNIDNGFGAGLTAARYARGVGEAVKKEMEQLDQVSPPRAANPSRGGD